MAHKRYDTLLFDLDNTLLDFTANETDGLNYLYDTYFADHIPKTAYLLAYHNINQALWRRVSFGECNPGDVKTERFKQLAQKYRLPLNEVTLARDYEHHISKNIHWLPGAKTALEQLKSHYKIGIITNGLTNTQTQKCQLSGISDWCNCILISESLGIAKPDPAIFGLAYKQLNTQASQCLMLGDSLHSDHKGAINTGMDFCWVKYRHDSDDQPEQSPHYEVDHVADLVDTLLTAK